MASVSFTNVCKIWPDGETAVDRLSLEIPEGEFLVLVGPSGCGKTTTLRMLAGLEDASSGEIRIGDRIVNDVEPKDRDVAMVFQNYALYPHMTVRQNMAFGLKLRKTPRSEIGSRIEWAAELLGLSDLLERKPAALSGGQKQRVAVGRAIVRQPKVFLFDEPLSNLDAKLRTQTRLELKSLHERLKTTTLFVTHDQEEAMTLGQRVAVMHDGVLQQCDVPLNIYRHPANRFVAGFLGSPEMNFLSAEVKAAGDDVSAVTDAFTIPLPDSVRQRVIEEKLNSLTVGIRPESVVWSRAVVENSPAARIELVELLGAEMILNVRYGQDRTLRLRVPASADLTSGRNLHIDIPSDACHFFAPGERGLNLASTPNETSAS